MTLEASPGAVTTHPRRTAWIVGGVLGFASLAAAGTIAIRTALPPPADAAPSPQAVAGPVATTKTTAGKPSSVRQGTTAARVASTAPVCADCGVVESVRSVTRKGKGSGLGAVAGGVVGAAVGNQIGKGNGRTAMTVLGAVGGGVAGHEIEKRARSVTVHEVRIRMDDGSLRTIELAQPPRAGERVIVQGDTLRPAPGSGDGATPAG